MARKPDVQYIRYYTDGSAARKPELEQPRRRRRALPKIRKQPVRVIRVDPLAIIGMVAALVLLVMMLSAFSELNEEQLQLQQMRGYVQTLEKENLHLAGTYEAELDLPQIEAKALALGMIPVEQAQHITIHVSQPVSEVPVEEPTLWETVCMFFEDLFA